MCEHESYTWIETAARCDACGLEITGTRLDPRYVGIDAVCVSRRLSPPPREIPPAVRLIAWCGELEMGGWTGSVHEHGIEAFASCVADELDFAGAAPPGVDDAIVIRLVDGGKPGRIVYRDGGVVR